MNYSTIDYLIVFAFLLTTLVLGLWAGRGIKDIREYGIGNKTFGPVALALTFLATDTGIVNLVEVIGAQGIILSATIIIGGVIAYIIFGLFIAPNMVYFDKCITMGDVMGTLYGPNSKIITGILGFLAAVCIAGMEIVVLGLLCESLFGIDYKWGVGVGGFLLATYTAYGGIKSVTVTDVFQFLILLVVMPTVVILALKHAGGIETVLIQLPTEKLQLLQHPQRLTYLVFCLSVAIFQVHMVDPAIVQRLLMARSQRQLRNQFLIILAFFPAIQLTIMVLGLSGLVLYPNLAGVQVVPQIVKELLPAGVKGLAIAGLFAVSMATVDSFLHAAGLTLVQDVVKPLCDKGKLVINELKWAKYATVFVSVFAIAIGFMRADNLYDLLLTSLELTGPLLVFPLWGGVMGLKPDKNAFYIAAAVTTVVLLTINLFYLELQGPLATMIGMIANGMIFLGIHVLRNKGFVFINRAENIAYLGDHGQQAVRPLTTWLKIPWRIVNTAQKQVAEYGAPYMLFGLISITYYIVSPFIWEHKDSATWELILYLRLLGALACGLLIVKDKWPRSFLPYLPTFWHLTLLYCLPFTSTVMFLITQGSVEWLINIAITIMFLIVLVDWLSFIILSALGITLGLVFYTLVIGPIHLQLDLTTGYLLVYTCIFSTLIALLFARRREQHLEAKLREIAAHYHTMHPTKTQDHPAAMRIANMIDHQVQESMAHYSLSLYDDNNMRQSDAFHTSTDCLQYFFPTALAVIQQGEQITAQIVQALKEHYMGPQSALLSLQSCVTTIVEAYHRRHAPSMQVDLELEKDYKIATSYAHLQYALIHVLRFMHAHDLSKQVRLWLTHPKGIHLRLSGHSLSLSSLDELCMLFPARATTKHLGLAISKLLLEAQGGDLLYAVNDLPKNTYTEFILTLPPTSLKDQLSA